MVTSRDNARQCCNPANIYPFKINNKNARNRCEINAKLTRKTPERRQLRRSDVFIANFYF